MYYYGNNGYYGGAQPGFAGYTTGGFGGGIGAAIWIVLFILLIIILGCGSFGGARCDDRKDSCNR